MRRDEQAVRLGLLDAGADGRLVQLDDVGSGAAREHRAGDDQLDEVNPTGGQLADPLAALGR